MLGLFRRKDNDSVVAVLEAEPTPIPVVTVPIKVRPQPIIGGAELEDYVKLAEKVHFAPPDLLHHRLVQFLLDNNVEVYPLDKVREYLDYKFGKPTCRDKYSAWEHTWGWHPLRSEDNDKLTSHEEGSNNGHIQHSPYRKIIPAPVLETVDLIAAHFAGSKPALYFYVADAVVPTDERDPFLSVTAGGLNFFVIERWDEPAFRR